MNAPTNTFWHIISGAALILFGLLTKYVTSIIKKLKDVITREDAHKLVTERFDEIRKDINTSLELQLTPMKYQLSDLADKFKNVTEIVVKQD